MDMMHIKILEKSETVYQQNVTYTVLQCVLLKKVIIWFYWEHTHVLPQTALMSWNVRSLSIVLVPVLYMRLLTGWQFFKNLILYTFVSFYVCFSRVSADMANKHVHYWSETVYVEIGCDL